MIFSRMQGVNEKSMRTYKPGILEASDDLVWQAVGHGEAGRFQAQSLVNNSRGCAAGLGVCPQGLYPAWTKGWPRLGGRDLAGGSGMTREGSMA